MSSKDESKPARRAAGRGRRGATAAQEPTTPGRGVAQVTPTAELPLGRRGRARAVTKPVAVQASPEASPPQELSAEGSPTSSEKGEKEKALVLLAKRPGFGVVGTKIKLIANYYPIGLANKKQLVVTQYNVAVEHTNLKLNRDDKRLLFYKCIHENTGVFGTRYRVAFDGVSICFCLEELRFPASGNGQNGKFEVYGRFLRMTREERFTVSFELVGSVAVDFSAVVPPGADEDPHVTPLQFLDILLRQQRSCYLERLSQEWYPFGRSIYNIPSSDMPAAALTRTKSMWRGLFGATRVGQGGAAFVNFDVSHSAFYKQQSVLEFMVAALNDDDPQPVDTFNLTDMGQDTTLSDIWRRTVNKAIKNRRICTRVRRQDDREEVVQFTVAGVSDKTAANCIFEIGREGEEPQAVSVATYFAQRYGQLQFPNLQVLEVYQRGKRRIHLPMERCWLAPTQRVTSKLNRDETSTILRHAAKPPQDRRKEIQDMAVRQSGFDRDPWLQTFGVRISKEMKAVQGRILPAPTIRYAPTTSGTNVVQVKEGVWDIKGQKFVNGATCGRIGVILCCNVPPYFNHFLTSLVRKCRELGMTMQSEVDHTDIAYLNAIDESQRGVIEQTLTEMRNAGYSLVVVVVPKKGCWQYNETKRSAETVVGVMTQCILENTVKTMGSGTGKGEAALTNLILKINTKLSGTNSITDAQALVRRVLLEPEHPTLLIGIDVTHPGLRNQKTQQTPSIAAIVGNLDDTMMRYSASFRVQRVNTETIVSGSLSELIRERLSSYLKHVHEQNKLLPEGERKKEKPERIVVFRDGVAEGQFRKVLEDELTGIKKGCQALDANYRPKITFMVAQKGHHTRFFPTPQGPSSGKAGNIVPGTVVDTDITHPQLFEFYLCSHFGIQGTSRPVRYHVLYDENEFTSDHLQSAAYYLCHVYTRCTRSVSIPAPIYYADLACHRARAWLSDKVPDFSSDTMSQTSGETSSSQPTESDWERWTQVVPELKAEMYFV